MTTEKNIDAVTVLRDQLQIAIYSLHGIVQETRLPTPDAAHICNLAERVLPESEYAMAATERAAIQPVDPMTTDEAREYLIKFMEQHFTDKTFHRYIRADPVDRSRLAGDFAWQMATALARLAAPISEDTGFTTDNVREAYRLGKIAGEAACTPASVGSIENEAEFMRLLAIHADDEQGRMRTVRDIVAYIDARATQPEAATEPPQVAKGYRATNQAELDAAFKRIEEEAATERSGKAADEATEHLLKIIAYAYQIAGAHEAPEHILDVLAWPEEATDGQVEAMLPYVPAGNSSAAPSEYSAMLKYGVLRDSLSEIREWALYALQDGRVSDAEARGQFHRIVEAGTYAISKANAIPVAAPAPTGESVSVPEGIKDASSLHHAQISPVSWIARVGPLSLWAFYNVNAYQRMLNKFEAQFIDAAINAALAAKASA